jgi:hypothetical protein
MDPLGFAAGDANLYRYVGNGATNGVDPGLQSRDANTGSQLIKQDRKGGLGGLQYLWDNGYYFHVEGTITVTVEDAGGRGVVFRRGGCGPRKCALLFRKPKTYEIPINFTHDGNQMGIGQWVLAKKEIDVTETETVQLSDAFVAQTQANLALMGAVPPPVLRISYGCWVTITRHIHLKFNYLKPKPAGR